MITDELASLLDEEHDVRRRALRRTDGLSKEEQVRLNELEHDLDRIFQLLQQRRRALSVFDRSTDGDDDTDRAG
ncbi:DUF2630 family protein [Amycolatopsis sp. FDAARGOS 1241]|uniref:DUF2630 family protein n=1 Tax=Amycolatopsis sp. FDAARGOS 1241 TaxID=2778070 RepID=UPI00195133FF|nr:DUF2630 family protein [Amycolatopsis sp. FDAARGOS 1241]QRP48623.1 DUF2630 family protein [Amycolatopsis sp. FDAARGOS 1241]